MKKREKKDILDLLENMRALHKMLADSSNDLLTDYLSTCQQAAISVGDLLEKDKLEGLQDMISTLEQYAEYCYEITVRGECAADDVNRLDDLIDAVAEKIMKLSIKIQIVFFPYKAEMWDSLESIYMAAAEDPDCEARVIPIPYYEMDQTVGKWVLKYDGGHFPLGIPIEFYKEYDVKTEQPDIAYIHNPYDNYNLVTSVHPDYYSFELKKHVGKLVYVPYYVNAGKLSEGHKNLPCYEHVDYIVLQSEQAKEDCRGMYCYDKILPLGSPKLDRVIRKCKEGVEMPESWKSIIGDRRTLMLNSTLEELLVCNEKILVKLMNFFKYIRTNKKVVIIWRPHPLYEATIRAMRPMLLEQYTELKNFFVNNEIGILDTTSDISSTVAAADGYIGSPASSVVNLFGAAGKPIFLFDDTITDVAPEEESKVVKFDSCCYVGDKLFAYSHCADYLFEIRIQDYMNADNLSDSSNAAQVKIKPITNISGDRLCICPYWQMKPLLGKLYFSPWYAPELTQYDPEKNVVKNIHADRNIGDIDFYLLQICDNSIFLMTAKHDLMAEYSVGKRKWIYHSRGLELLFERTGMDQDAAISGNVAYKRKAYFSTGAANRILCISAGTGNFELIDLGSKSVTKDIPVFLLGASEEGLWIEILSNNYKRSGTLGIYLAPWECLNSVKDWKYIPLISESNDRYEGTAQSRFFAKAYEFGDYMVICPEKHKHIFRIQRKSGEVTCLAEGFWESMREENFPAAKTKGIIKNLAVAANDTYILIQRQADKRMALINVPENTFTEFVPKLSDDDFKAMLKENEGFRKGGKYGYFAMRESEIYSFQYFLSQFINTGWKQIKERQISALKTFAANLDGSCGEKVHSFIKKAALDETGRQ